jgi:hypothetical protein
VPNSAGGICGLLNAPLSCAPYCSGCGVPSISSGNLLYLLGSSLVCAPAYVEGRASCIFSLVIPPALPSGWFWLRLLRRKKHQAKIAETPARAAIPIPTPMPIDAPVERPEVEFEFMDVEATDEGDAEDVDDPDVVVVADGGDEEVELVAPAMEVVYDEDEDGGELELELGKLTSKRDTGKESVWPSVALGLLLQAALIASRTVDNRN